MRGQDVGEYIGRKRAYWRKFLRETGHQRVLDPERQHGLRVLDAGCGPAGVFTVLAKASVTAVDPLLDDYDELPHFERTAYPNVHWRALPLEDFGDVGAYDYVFCQNVINHVRDLGTVLRVLAKALRSDGTLVISVDAHRHAWLKPVFQALPGDILHPHQLSIDDYLDACREAGLDVVDEQLYATPFLFDYWVLTLKLATDEGAAH